MLGRRDVVAVAIVAGLGSAAPLAAQIVLNDNVVIEGSELSWVRYPSGQEPVSKWIMDATLPSFWLGHSVAPADNPNPTILKPFVVTGGMTNLLVLDDKGIGSGTATPQASFHVARSDGSAQIRVEENTTRGFVASRNLLRLLNRGPVTVRLDDKATGQAWSFGSTLTGYFYVASTPGVTTGFALSPSGDVTIGGTLTQGSDRNSKQAIEPVDGAALLERVARLPLATWEYKDAAGVRHLGPMAQDFAAEFGLGADDKHIAPGDAAGVGLAAIQALKSENDALRSRLAALEGQVAALAAR
jgi:hypothetical protein